MPRSIGAPSHLQPPDSPVNRMLARIRQAQATGQGEVGATSAIANSRILQGAKGQEDAPGVFSLLVDKAEEVNQMQHQADGMVHEMLTGGDVNSVEVLTAVQKADMAFRTMLQVRNKLIEAYREVLQIQV